MSELNASIHTDEPCRRDRLYDAAISLNYLLSGRLKIDMPIVDSSSSCDSSNGKIRNVNINKYFVYRWKYQSVFIAASWCLIITHIFERPLWSYDKENWNAGSLYPSTKLSVLPLWSTALLYTISIIVCYISVYMYTIYTRTCIKEYHVVKSKLRLKHLNIVLLALSLKSIEVLMQWIQLGRQQPPTFSFSPIEAIIPIYIDYHYTYHVKYLVESFPRFFLFALLLMSFVLSFSALAYALINPQLYQDASVYFGTYSNSIWNMLMVLNGSDWPCPMIPMYSRNRLFAIFFGLYLVIVNWGVLNFILSIVYISLIKLKSVQFDRSPSLISIFKALDVDITTSLSYELIGKLFYTLLDIRGSKVKALPTAQEQVILATYLDRTHNGYINLADFLRISIDDIETWLLGIRTIATATNANVNSSTLTDHIVAGTAYNTALSPLSEMEVTLRRITVDEYSRRFSSKSKVLTTVYRCIKADNIEVFLDSSICLIALVFVFGVATVEVLTAFLVMLCIEPVAMVLVAGYGNYVKKRRHRMRLILTCMYIVSFAVISSTYHNGDIDNSYSSNVFTRAIIVTRLCSYPQNLLILVPELKRRTTQLIVVIAEIFTNAREFQYQLSFMFVFMYAYASLGCQLFGGLICKEGTPYVKIMTSLYGQSGFWPYNFNDVPSGVATMFTLLSVNNMHVTTSGFVAVTSAWAELYFGVYYVVGVLYLLNNITVYILSEFLAYVEKQANAITSSSSNGSSRHSNGVPMTDEASAVVSMMHVPSTPSSGNPHTHHTDTETGTDTVNRIDGSSRSIDMVLGKDTLHDTDADIYNIRRDRFSASPFASKRLRTELSSMLKRVVTGGTFTTITKPVAPAATVDSDERDFLRESLMCRTDASDGTFLAESEDIISKGCEIKAYEIAAIFIQYARDGIPHAAFPNTRISLLFHRIRHRTAPVFKFASWTLLLLRVFETPYWAFAVGSDWVDNAVYPQTPLPQLSFTTGCYLEISLLLVVLVGSMCELIVQIAGVKWLKHNKSSNGCKYYLLVAFNILQIIVLSIAIHINDNNLNNRTHTRIRKLVWVSSFLNIIYIYWFNAKAFQKFRFLLSCIPKLLYSVSSILLIVMVFAAAGPFIFKLDDSSYSDDDSNDDVYFNNFGNSVWSIFVAITSSSYPDQVRHGYVSNRLFFVFYFVFVCIGSFICLNIILVIIFIEYNKAKQKASDRSKAVSILFLHHAFYFLDSSHIGRIEKQDIHIVFDELYTYYHSFIKDGMLTDSKKDILLSILDIDNDGGISSHDFEYILSVMRIKLHKIDRLAEVETLRVTLLNLVQTYIYNGGTGTGVGNSSSSSSNSSISSSWCRVGTFTWKSFGLLIDVINIVFVALALALNADSHDGYGMYYSSRSEDIMTVMIILLYTFECVTRVVSIGYKAFIIKVGNRCTVAILVLLVIDTIVLYSVRGQDDHHHVISACTYVSRILIMVRVIIIPRNIIYALPVHSYKLSNFDKALRRVIRSVGTVTEVFILVIYMFCSVGIVLFGGTICTSTSSCKYDSIAASPYGQNNFWDLNFNDYPAAFVTLFSCLHVSDFDVISSGFEASTSSAARVFFGLWYVIGVLLILNVLKSLFINGFDGLLTSATVPTTAKEPSNYTFIMNYKWSNAHSSSSSSDAVDGTKSSVVKQYHITLEYLQKIDSYMMRRLVKRLRDLTSDDHSTYSVSANTATATGVNL